MEFPDLGQHCDDPTCKQLDFLPMKCDSCTKTFCKDHFPYDIHGCPEAHRKNFQVPVCPLCNEPVPFKRGEVPDICVSQHLDRDCRSDRRRKIYNNRCNKKGCKTKELVKITCDGCRLTFCLKHRLEVDHDCRVKAAGRPSPAASMAAAAAINRLQPSQNSNQSRITSFMTSSTSRNTVAASNPRPMGSTRVLSTSHPPPISRPPPGLQPQGLSEDEALAQAMSLSLQDSQPSTAIEPNANMPSLTEDEMLARAIAASEEEERARQRRNGNSNNSSSNSNVEDSRANCAIS